MLNKKIVIIDNYDSFTYNLVHLVENITSTKIEVLLNDNFELNDLEQYDFIILSPGPGLPADAGKMMQVIERFKNEKNILGVCLGHQAIGLAFGCELKNLENVYHGIDSLIQINECELKNTNSIFYNFPVEINVGRYHSWVIDNEKISSEVEIIALDANGIIMAIKHKYFNIYGVQFHPESIMTECGEELFRNWLSLN